ncbi:MAG: hypothetical protein FWJ62_01275 [Thermaerobacter sp.]|nr:hypothetical protein [Bacillota bacterium]
MKAELLKVILAVVALPGAQVEGNVPILRAADRASAEKKADLIARILDAMVHDVGDGVFLIVRH